MKNDNDPRALYYAGRASCNNELIRKSAELGFTPAMADYGRLFRTSGFLQKAFDLDELEAFPEYVCESNFELCKKAADRGHFNCMLILSSNFRDRLSDIECITFAARYVISTNRNFEMPTDLGLAYVAGREFQGYDQLWPMEGRHYQPSVKLCMQIYQNGIMRARRAALCTVMCLRGIVGKDVARLIGKYVYQTRGSISE